MTRGSLAAGAIRTYVLHDRITRASCFVCLNAGDAVALAALDRGRAAGHADVPRVGRRPRALAAGAAARGEDARRRPDVPRALALDDRRCRRAEHDDPQLLRAEHGVRDAAGAGQARARDPRGEHGRRQEAVGRVLPVRARQDRARRGVPPRRADPARAPHDGRGSRGALVGRDARLGRMRDAVGRVHARLGDRRDLRRDGPGSRHGRHQLDGARHRAARRGRPAGLDPLRRPRGRARSAAARPFPPRATGSPRSAAPAPGRSTASRRSSRPRRSALEISASAAMATAGSENFFKAHHERGGLR